MKSATSTEGNALKVEKNIPLPLAGNKGYTAILRRLKKGESVLLPTSIQSAAALGARSGRAPKTFTMRMVEGGTRVWCIK